MKSHQTPLLRLDHFLSACGVCARRKVRALLHQKPVMVNGKKITDLSFKVHPKKDKVTVGGKPLNLGQKKWYIAFNKPKKIISAFSDPKVRPCLALFFEKLKKQRLFPVGRLDWHSESLMLITNDGDFTGEILSKKPPKTYLVKLNGRPTLAQLLKLQKGVLTEIGRLKALYVKNYRSKDREGAWVKVILAEGKNRQLHRMFEKIGFQIKILRRVAIGKLKLKSLKPGESFLLSPKDIKKIFSIPSELADKKKPYKKP